MTYEPQDGMHAHRQEVDAGTSSHHNTMANSRFKIVSEQIEQMLEETNKVIDENNFMKMDPLGKAVADLQGMWTTMKSNSEGDMSQDLDVFVEKLREARPKSWTWWNYRTKILEEVTGLLDLCLVKLTGHKNGYGTWEDPPVCSNCKRPLWLVNDRELSCNHVFHRECVPKSGQPCPRCTAEGGQTS
ncbi:hypothetical protein SeLEV6574_g05390 [Synchytrium endobioticum]|uniref:RING-type domain-containing protein n=1 Tax=Synchytrium endobioticum TaxID=286115 RepID=A0A507CUG9_9FUNG|nr:hypothetical protein SeLEV6574_g05390 [Synchytrium endobioticum]